jgi:hypothetical protein
MPDHLKPLLGECYPAYEIMRSHALKPLDDSVPRQVPLQSDAAVAATAREDWQPTCWQRPALHHAAGRVWPVAPMTQPGRAFLPHSAGLCPSRSHPLMACCSTRMAAEMPCKQQWLACVHSAAKNSAAQQATAARATTGLAHTPTRQTLAMQVHGAHCWVLSLDATGAVGFCLTCKPAARDGGAWLRGEEAAC